jgi:hypothetical protein
VYCHRVSTKCVLPPGVNPIAVDNYIKIMYVQRNIETSSCNHSSYNPHFLKKLSRNLKMFKTTGLIMKNSAPRKFNRNFPIQKHGNAKCDLFCSWPHQYIPKALLEQGFPVVFTSIATVLLVTPHRNVGHRLPY